jgi:uncharacterized protein (DUF58 family)
MLPREVVSRIRRLQIRAKRAVEDLLGGEYHSVFKGVGVAFEEVRAYQPGDDIRSIDWNVTARMGQPFVKRFVEERELTVMLVVDASRSQFFGTARYEKRDVIAELTALLAFSALSNNDRVGLIVFTDLIERFVPPRKGLRHVLRLMRDVLCWQPSRRGTSIHAALDYLNRILPRRAIVFLISDYCDLGYERTLKHTGRRHDLVAIQVSDPREANIPDAGLVQLEDAETGAAFLIDTHSPAVRAAYAREAGRRQEALRRLMRSAQVDLVEASTDGTHLQSLIRFFQLRERRLRRP